MSSKEVSSLVSESTLAFVPANVRVRRNQPASKKKAKRPLPTPSSSSTPTTNKPISAKEEYDSFMEEMKRMGAL